MTNATIIRPFGPDYGPTETRNSILLDSGRSGEPSEVYTVPALVARAMINRVAGALPIRTTAALEQMGVAAELFADSTVDGVDFEGYLGELEEFCGLSSSVARRSAEGIVRALREAGQVLEAERPRGAELYGATLDAGGGGAVWSRRGRSLAVIAPGNTPGAHSLWPIALAYGYGVVVRPSVKDPFTPYRLVKCLANAGFDDQISYIPTSHETVDSIVECADFTLLYGGSDVVAKYANSPKVVTQGPGQSKIVVDCLAQALEHLDLIVESITDHNGAACTCATSVLTLSGDHEEIAKAIATRIMETESDRPVIRLPDGRAAALRAAVLAAAGPSRNYINAEIADADGSGYSTVRPAVFSVDSDVNTRINSEFGFPCVWVASVADDELQRAISTSLVLTTMSTDKRIVDFASADPTVRNIYVGRQKTTWMSPVVPHDGYLSEHLMFSKGAISC
ncbi:aldehyde dehydrogenase family protein [Tsukamurella ocularis]|uniref:aldehyde dehydrogenase family protein n=1 Tax=Tsukamurella ocularis TaxID=1970234 RepID=UPI002169EDD5|nr:aldehyde dehydrogenase family protein [Tsukamurella ocularis]MCS3779340.1 acyl-CoA reductase-like NAD-dependent aldehyde dehydrogenase [Tsukamurella ocularis]MCS3789934.1 acyl-CoA reductase-like NAD-dependent aldehyde dehydrogenase [Tsukamurella ocularis]MCS3852431.1 acyl-CoA reductase-like NAD-dependent aldehyde dehydrogenase [Tsukamurella ocularis]